MTWQPGGIQIADAKEFIQAAIANTEMASQLDFPLGAPVLVARRRSHDADGAAIEYAVMHHRPLQHRPRCPVNQNAGRDAVRDNESEWQNRKSFRLSRTRSPSSFR